jgi:hypothetical protein
MTAATRRGIVADVACQHLRNHQEGRSPTAGDRVQRRGDVATDEGNPAGQLVGRDIESRIDSS